MKKFSSYFIVVALFFATSCAGLISGKTQSVFLRTTDGSEDVNVEVISANGVQNATIPSTVIVPRSKSPLTIKVKESACLKASTDYATSNYNIWLLADVIGGIFGLTGTTTDMSSGAAWAYEDNVYVNTKKKAGCK